MVIIVGLGNPSQKYEGTRHNFGKRVIKKFAEDFKFPKFKLKRKLKAKVSHGEIGSQKIILALPTTYMNNSGQAIKLLVTSYRQPATNLWVIHDDLDLPFGKIKISIQRSAAGHQGIQSIIDTLGSKNFVRFRLGIGPKEKIRMGAFPPQRGEARSMKLSGGLPEPEGRRRAIRMQKFVLEKFGFREKLLLSKIVQEAIQAIQVALEQCPVKAMSKFN